MSVVYQEYQTHKEDKSLCFIPAHKLPHAASLPTPQKQPLTCTNAPNRPTLSEAAYKIVGGL